MDPTLPDDITSRTRELGPLESPLIWMSFALAGLALLVAVLWLGHHRGWRRYGGAAAALLLLLAAVTGVNAYAGFVRTGDDLARLLQRGPGVVATIGRLLDDGKHLPRDARRPPPGATAPSGDPGDPRVAAYDLPDPAHGIPVGHDYVVLPPGYDAPANAQRRYPAVYLIHGYPFGGPADWLTAGDAPSTLRLLLDHHTVSPMILVSVDMTAGDPSQDWECLDVPDGPRLDTYLARTVVPGIDKRFRTLADRGDRALGGMSGGAFCALNTGLHHLDLFATLLATLPYDDPGDAKALLGEDRAAQRADTPRDYIPTMVFREPVATLLAAGTGAPTDVGTAHRIANALRHRGQQAVVHTEPGFNHTWHTARATLPYLLAFADRRFPRGGSPAP